MTAMAEIDHFLYAKRDAPRPGPCVKCGNARGNILTMWGKKVLCARCHHWWDVIIGHT